MYRRAALARPIASDYRRAVVCRLASGNGTAWSQLAVLRRALSRAAGLRPPPADRRGTDAAGGRFYVPARLARKASIKLSSPFQVQLYRGARHLGIGRDLSRHNEAPPSYSRATGRRRSSLALAEWGSNHRGSGLWSRSNSQSQSPSASSSVRASRLRRLQPHRHPRQGSILIRSLPMQHSRASLNTSIGRARVIAWTSGPFCRRQHCSPIASH
jgi:hypothetical protein